MPGSLACSAAATAHAALMNAAVAQHRAAAVAVYRAAPVARHRAAADVQNRVAVVAALQRLLRRRAAVIRTLRYTHRQLLPQHLQQLRRQEIAAAMAATLASQPSLP